MTIALLDPMTVATLLSVSRSSLKRWASLSPPIGPRRIKVGERRCAYDAREVEAFIATRAAVGKSTRPEAE